MKPDEITQLVDAMRPFAECALPPNGYEHLGVTAHFSTDEVVAAKAAMRNAEAYLWGRVVKDHDLTSN